MDRQVFHPSSNDKGRSPVPISIHEVEKEERKSDMNIQKNLPKLAGALLLASTFGAAMPASAQWREVPSKPGKPAVLPTKPAVQGEGRWTELKLWIKTMGVSDETSEIAPGGRFSLPENGRFRVIMMAYTPGGRDRIYPATVFREAQVGRGGIKIAKESNQNSNYVVDVLNIRERYGSRSERVSYEINDARVPRHLRTGSFVIDVLSSEEINNPQGQNQGGGWGRRPGRDDGDRPGINVRTRAGQMTQVLYRAILLREPDAGAQGFTDRIERDGYDGLVTAATTIAQSNESRRDIYQQKPDLTPERRVTQIYRELLGVREGEYDRRTFDEDVRLVQDGKVAVVVGEIVRSQRFRDLYSY
jgi:hypothetical protein